MTVTVTNLITNLDTYLGDSSTDRISTAERYQALTEAMAWYQESTQDDLTVDTYQLNYFDTVHRYKVTTDIADLLRSADLRREESIHNHSFAHKSSRELAEEIGQNFSESSFSIERADNQAYLLVNHPSKYQAHSISGFESLTDGGGTWQVDSTNSDATNLTVDNNEFEFGNGSLNFDVDVSQSGNDKATVYNDDLTIMNLTDYEDISSAIMEVYIPDVTNISSVTLFWGSSSSAYWSVTSTTDIGGNAFVNGFNTIKFDWSDATATSSPDVTSVNYVRIDINYTGSQTDDTDFRIDYLRIVRPEKLTFYYTSSSIGTNNSGTKIYAFTAGTDIPYFSGQYDQAKFAVAHKAASILFASPLRLQNQSILEESQARDQLKRIMKIIPKSSNPEVKSFKLNGVSFRRRNRKGR